MIMSEFYEEIEKKVDVDWLIEYINNTQYTDTPTPF